LSGCRAGYASQLDGDWEHEWSVRIETIDTPGWLVKIDLEETELSSCANDDSKYAVDLKKRAPTVACVESRLRGRRPGQTSVQINHAAAPTHR
jgi:hypothetical protein